MNTDNKTTRGEDSNVDLLEGITPGKWAIRDNEIIGPYGSDKCICEMTGNFMSEEEKKANIRLISLAPQLAKENKRLHKTINDLLETGSSKLSIQQYQKLKEENKSLREANERLKEALKNNHQWALCLLADIEAGNVEYDEKYCLELNQDISETTELLK